MRRFFAVISAIALAFIVTGVLSLYQKGVPLKGINFEVIKEAFHEKTKGKPALPSSEKNDESPTPEKEPELNLTYDERIKKGDYFMERGFLTFAVNEYVKAANLEPNRTEPYLKMLQANYELRDYKKALKNAETILKFDPNHYETKFTLSLIYLKQSDFETARNLLANLPATQTPDPRVTYYKALLSSLFGNHEDAKKLLGQAKIENPSADLEAKINFLLDAYTEFEFAQASEPLYLSELLARGYNKAEEYEMALYTLKEVLKIRNDLRDGWILFGFAYLNLGKYYFAQTAFERAYQLDSEWPTTQYFLGLTHKELGNTEDSIIFFNYALANQFEPVSVIHQHLADLYFDKEDYSKAIESYEKVLDLEQGDVNAFVRPIWLYLDYLKTPEKALKMAEKAMVSFPNSAMSHNLLGWSLTGMKSYAEAEKNLKKAIEMDSTLAAAHYNLGRLYQIQGKKSDALSFYQQAYNLDPSGSIGNLAAQEYNQLLIQ